MRGMDSNGWFKPGIEHPNNGERASSLVTRLDALRPRRSVHGPALVAAYVRETVKGWHTSSKTDSQVSCELPGRVGLDLLWWPLRG